MCKTITLFFILAINFSQAQIPKNITGSKISLDDAKEILAHHNKVRKNVRAAALVWSPKLSAYAQSWANHLARANNCEIKHRTQCGEDGKNYGENIFWGSSSDAYKPIDASLSWYSEIKNYSYTRLNENNWETTGHYTQMVWKDTREVGAGVAICANGAIIVVANYYPAGNVIGQYPY